MSLDLEKYRAKLIRERDRIEQEMNMARSEVNADIDRQEINAANAPQMGEAADIEAEVADMMSDRLEKIYAALQSINQGTYGTCIKCGKQISPERLDAEPEAVTCMDCLTEKEKSFQTYNM